MHEFNNDSDFEMTFKDHYSYMYNLAFKITGDSSGSEDVVQNIFMNIWKKRSKIKIETSIRAYLHRSTINACYDFISKSKKTISLERSESKDQFSEHTEQQVAHNELQEKLEIAIKNLPTKCQVIFSLSRFKGLSSQQIADELAISKKTVDNQIGIALQKLRTELKEFITLKSVSLLILIISLLLF